MVWPPLHCLYKVQPLHSTKMRSSEGMTTYPVDLQGKEAMATSTCSLNGNDDGVGTTYFNLKENRAEMAASAP